MSGILEVLCEESEDGSPFDFETVLKIFITSDWLVYIHVCTIEPLLSSYPQGMAVWPLNSGWLLNTDSTG